MSGCSALKRNCRAVSVFLCAALFAAGCASPAGQAKPPAGQERLYKEHLAAARRQDEQRLGLQRKAEEERQRQQTLQEKRYQESLAAAKKEDERRLAAQGRAEQEARRQAQFQEQKRLAAQRRTEEETRRRQELETKRLAEEKRLAQEQLAAQRKAEQEAKTAEETRRKEQAAAAKKAAQQRLTAQKKAEEDDRRLAEEKRQAQEQLEAQRKAEAARQAEVQRLAEARQEVERRQNEEAERLESYLEKTWKARQAVQARKETQAAHRTASARPETKPEQPAASPFVRRKIVSPREIPLGVYRLRPGDQLACSVWGHPDLSASVSVREDGVFMFPLIGPVQAAGRSLQEVELDIGERLNRDYIVNPQVTAHLTGAKFSVFGEVQQPGSFPIEGSMDLLSALSIAGGITKFGSNRVEIIRGQGEEKVTIRAHVDRIVQGKDPNVEILPHDTIYIKRRIF